jgi:hypothetical protein
MLRVLGNSKRLCDGLTRRELLQLSALGFGGLGAGVVSSPVGAELPTERARCFGKAKACILLYLYGAPSQLETFDPKPAAPEGIRGELGTIPSIVPGIDLCALLPRLARVMDKVTVVRSMTHPYPNHGVAYALTGIPRIGIPMEVNHRDAAHWPFMGSVVDFCDERRQPAGARGPELPRNLVLPWPFSSQRLGETPRAGPYGGFLGSAYDPICTEFVGRATRKSQLRINQEIRWEGFDPYLGITPASSFRLSAVGGGPDGPALRLDALDRRRSLLEQVERAQPALDRVLSRSGMDRQRAMACALLGAPRLRQAFDLDREPPTMRAHYGMTLFGQATLTARRLVEAGGRFVTVFWDEFGEAGSGWDTHIDHYPRMKDGLMPGLDETLSALLEDLDQRGMLDETLVLCLSEHGRTPKLDNLQNGGGRGHWSRCYSVLLAGGGVARGRVVGRSDKIASDPLDDPVSPKDILATAYHVLGVDPSTILFDRQQRPQPLVPEGRVLTSLLA